MSTNAEISGPSARENERKGERTNERVCVCVGE
jgi:hypothetical protein